MKSVLGWLVALAMLTAIALLCCINTEESELGHRSAFYQSLVKDGDLNIVTQVPASDRWLVTRTHNHPTHVGNGIVSLWYPFYEYVRLLLTEGGAEGKLIFEFSGYQAAAILRNVFFLLLSWVLIRRFNPGQAEWLLPLLFLATPILWYVFFEPFRVEPSALVLSAVLSLGVLGCWGRSSTPRYYFMLGLGIGWAYTVVSAFGVFTGPVLARLSSREPRALPKLAALGIGLALSIALNSINSVLHTGSLWPASYGDILSLVKGDDSHAIDLLFGPRSVVLSAPVYFLLFLASLALPALALSPRVRSTKLAAETRSELWPLWLLPGVFLAVFVVLHRQMASVIDEIPNRNMIYVFPLLASAFLRLAGPVARRRAAAPALAILLLVCAVPNWTAVAQNGAANAIGEKLGAALTLHSTRIRDLWRLLELLPLMGLLAWILAFTDRAAREGDRGKLVKAGGILTATLFAGHAMVTCLNVAHNRAKVDELLRAGFFTSSVVSQGPELDLYDEVLSIFENGMTHLPPERIPEVLRARSAYLARAMSEVGADPIGFRDAWLRGCVRPSVWSSGMARCDSP